MATGQINTVANGTDMTREEIGETHNCTVINKSHKRFSEQHGVKIKSELQLHFSIGLDVCVCVLVNTGYDVYETFFLRYGFSTYNPILSSSMLLRASFTNISEKSDAL